MPFAPAAGEANGNQNSASDANNNLIPVVVKFEILDI